MTTSSQNANELLRRQSKLLFGNADRLQVAAAVARSSGLVHAQGLADELDMAPPRVRAQLLAFTDAGLLDLLPRTDRVQSYERVDHPFWAAIEQLVREWS